jgi:hypothetical protein
VVTNAWWCTRIVFISLVGPRDERHSLRTRRGRRWTRVSITSIQNRTGNVSRALPLPLRAWVWPEIAEVAKCHSLKNLAQVTFGILRSCKSSCLPIVQEQSDSVLGWAQRPRSRSDASLKRTLDASMSVCGRTHEWIPIIRR